MELVVAESCLKDFSRMEKLLPLIKDLYELHNLRKTTVTSNLMTAITTVIVFWRRLHRSQCACIRCSRYVPVCNHFYFSPACLRIHFIFYYHFVGAHVSFSFFCSPFFSTSVVNLYYCESFVFAHLLNGFGISQRSVSIYAVQSVCVCV